MTSDLVENSFSQQVDPIRVALRIPRKAGHVKAIAHVTLRTQWGLITLRWFRVVELDERTRWVSFPSLTYLHDGKPVNRAVLTLPKPFRHQVEGSDIEKVQRSLQSTKASRGPERL